MQAIEAKRLFLAATFVIMALAAAPAEAYIGPGAGISAIGTFLAVVGGVALLIVGFLWYPVKRLLKNRKKGPDTDDPSKPANPQ